MGPDVEHYHSYNCQCAVCRSRLPKPATEEDLKFYEEIADNFWEWKAMDINAKINKRNAERLLDELMDECKRIGYEHAEDELKSLRAKAETLRRERDELLAAINKFLSDNNPEGFGCACEPNRLCGPCSEAKRQAPLYAAIAKVKP